MVGANIEFETVPCNLCGEATNFKFLYKKPDTRFFISNIEFNVVQCRRCGLAFVNPRPTEEAIKVFYPTEFYEKREVESQIARYKKEARYLDDLMVGRVLDVGCAGGAFLKVLQDKGWETYGMDISDSLDNEYNLDIRYGDLYNINYPDNYFDAITAWAVFEHLHNPMRYFIEVSRILKAGGRFVFLVTNVKSLGSRFAYVEDIPRHLYFFSKSTLAKYAQKVNLHLTKVEYSNKIYLGTGERVIRVNLLRWLNVSWKDICEGKEPSYLRPISLFSQAIGRLLIWPSIEVLLRRSTIIVVTMQK